MIVWNRHGGKNQRWKVLYTDKAKDIQTKGLNEDFGFQVNRPFYIRSRMLFKRVLQCHGANNIALNRYAKTNKAQQWFFDGATKTIKNNQWKTHSLNIQSNGGSPNLQVLTTNARWW